MRSMLLLTLILLSASAVAQAQVPVIPDIELPVIPEFRLPLSLGLTEPFAAQFAQLKKSPLLGFTGLRGMFWRDPATVMKLGLTEEQQQKMDDIFRQYRLNLVDVNAAVEKEELILEPLVEALPQGDQAKLLAQVDRVAQARAELEKANSRLMIGIIQVMTPEQVRKLPAKGKSSILPYLKP